MATLNHRGSVSKGKERIDNGDTSPGRTMNAEVKASPYPSSQSGAPGPKTQAVVTFLRLALRNVWGKFRLREAEETEQHLK
jgi:hypothetical protein